MKSVSLLELRRNTASILRRTQTGERMILTVRGKPVMRLEPIGHDTLSTDDPFYQLASRATIKDTSLSNRQIDEIIYGN